MAKATKKVQEVIEEVTLTVSLEEAQVLAKICANVTGSSHFRRLTDSIDEALGELGITYSQCPYEINTIVPGEQ